MTEDKIFEEALKRAGSKVVRTEWNFMGEILLEDQTNHVDYWFRGNELYAVEHCEEY